MIFGHRGAPPVWSLKKITHANPEVIKELRKFVNIETDCTNTNDPKIKQIWEKYRIVGLPTIVFINKDGTGLPAINYCRLSQCSGVFACLTRVIACQDAGYLKRSVYYTAKNQKRRKKKLLWLNTQNSLGICSGRHNRLPESQILNISILTSFYYGDTSYIQ